MKTGHATMKDVARFNTMSAEEIIALKEKEKELGKPLNAKQITDVKREVNNNE